MPTYDRDGSIEPDSTNSIGIDSAGGRGGGATAYSDAWFREHYSTLDGLQADREYEHYEPAFRYGWESAGTRGGRGWTESEGDLARDWQSRHAERDWHENRGAIRHAFERAMHVFDGAKDPDEK